MYKRVFQTVKMSGEEIWSSIKEESSESLPPFDNRSDYYPRTGIYHSLVMLETKHEIPAKPDLYTATLVLSQFPQGDLADARIAFVDLSTNYNVTCGEIRRSVMSLATGLFHGLEIRKGDVLFLLSLNSILTTTNPLNTKSEIAKQVHDSGAKVAISTPKELHKLVPTGVPTILTTGTFDGKFLSIEELIEGCYDS